jgi:hypothetical protein
MLSRNLAESSPEPNHRESMLIFAKAACFRGGVAQITIRLVIRESMAHAPPTVGHACPSAHVDTRAAVLYK